MVSQTNFNSIENLKQVYCISNGNNWNLITLIQRHICIVDISFICLYWCVVQSLEYCIMDFQRFQFFTAWGRAKRFCRHFAIPNGLYLYTHIKYIIYHNTIYNRNILNIPLLGSLCCQALLVLVWWCHDGLVMWSHRQNFILLFKSFIRYENHPFILLIMSLLKY